MVDTHTGDIAQLYVENVPLALGFAAIERAKELDRAKPKERDEQLRLAQISQDALEWMEHTLSARKEKLTPNSQAAATVLRKQLEELRKE